LFFSRPSTVTLKVIIYNTIMSFANFLNIVETIADKPKQHNIQNTEYAVTEAKLNLLI